MDFDALVLGPCFDAFAEPIAYATGSGASGPSRGVFDDRFREVVQGADGELALSTGRPVLGVRVAEFAPGTVPEQGDTVTILRTGRTYTVEDVNDDSHGLSKLALSAAPGSQGTAQ